MDDEIIQNKLITYMMVEFYWDEVVNDEDIILNRFVGRMDKYLKEFNIKRNFNSDDRCLLYACVKGFYLNTKDFSKQNYKHHSVWYQYYRERYLNIQGLKYKKNIDRESINTIINKLYNERKSQHIYIEIDRDLVEYAVEMCYVYKQLQPKLYETKKDKYTIFPI